MFFKSFILLLSLFVLNKNVFTDSTPPEAALVEQDLQIIKKNMYNIWINFKKYCKTCVVSSNHADDEDIITSSPQNTANKIENTLPQETHDHSIVEKRTHLKDALSTP